MKLISISVVLAAAAAPAASLRIDFMAGKLCTGGVTHPVAIGFGLDARTLCFNSTQLGGPSTTGASTWRGVHARARVRPPA